MSDLHIKQQQTTKMQQMQRLMMLPQMQQALHILQMPALELGQLIDECLAENPLVNDQQEIGEEVPEQAPDLSEQDLAFNDQDFSLLSTLDDNQLETYSTGEPHTDEDEEHQTYREQNVLSRVSLFQHLMEQAQQYFQNADDLKVAEILIGNFDKRGFLEPNWKELEFLYSFSEERLKVILKQIQTFVPYGVGATSIQESLLIQLERKNQKDTLAYAIINIHYDDFLHNRMSTIQKKLGCSAHELADSLKSIRLLDLSPGSSFTAPEQQTLVPDVEFALDGDQLKTIVNNQYVPEFRINRRYLRLLEDPNSTQETKAFVQEKLNALKWLMRTVTQRSSTLEKLAHILAERQQAFLSSPEGKLLPLTMKALAQELGLNESTVTRALSNKYFACPRGTLPFHTLFSHEMTASLSTNTVQEAIQEIIRAENKQRPYSDSAIAQKLSEQGMPCARRTVAKYRTILRLGSAQQRKSYME